MTTLTTDEAAEWVGVSVWTIRRWDSRGLLAPVRPGASPLRYREADVVSVAASMMSARRHAALDKMASRLDLG